MKKFAIIFISLLMLASWCDDNNGPDVEDKSCEVCWTKYSSNPVMVPGATGEWDDNWIWSGSVIYHEGVYHMWYTGGNSSEGIPRIGHATSPDGITWTKDPDNPVLDLGPEGSWDDSRIHGPSVLLINSQFHMWYSGDPFPSGTYASTRIGHATSPDGTTWTKYPNNPIMDHGPNGSFDDTWISAPFVLYNGSEYHMWYTGDGGQGTYTQMGHATSPDGISWTRDPHNPVLSCTNSAGWDYDRAGFAQVIYDGTTYHMWYSGGETYAWRIGYATSEDGSAWTKSKHNPVLSFGSAGSWEESMVASCVVMKSGEKYLMWYSGGSTVTGNVRIGYAESDICTTGN
jgi:predicted GH43/DUF377 family glycosyl hydrolase